MAKLTHVALFCEDLNASRRFYEALGFSFQEQRHNIGPTHFVTILSDVTIALWPIMDKQDEFTFGPRRLGVTVENLLNVISSLEALTGVTGTSLKKDLKKVFFRDPDGRTIEITQP